MKATREKVYHIIGNASKVISGFLNRYFADQERVELYNQSAERNKEIQLRILYLTRLSFRIEGSRNTSNQKMK